MSAGNRNKTIGIYSYNANSSIVIREVEKKMKREEFEEKNPCEKCKNMWINGACIACEHGGNDSLNTFGGEE